MPEYKVPLRDMRFVLNEVLDLDAHYAKLGLEEVNSELLNAFLEEGAKFAENELAPLNRSGDEEGCHFEDGVVTTPQGFKEAYAKYVEGGWPAMGGDPEFGGQGLPGSASIAISEMTGTANWSWSMYPGLSHGAVATIEAHGTDEQKQTYLPKLTSGEWTGTMCLTEPHCGSDLGILKSKAEPQADGSYKITGTKIFISAGEHDMAENIVHIVLARLPEAPKGTKGISLFIVPKFLTDGNGGVGERNAVACGSIEHKMGIKASATCVMNFDGATGYLIGPENKGLNCMFTFMNFARLGTAIQGVAHAELGFQGGLTYAKDRLAMRSLSGPKNPDGPADPIIVHPDVRRMLLTSKAFAEGGRALVYLCAQLGDSVKLGKTEEEREEAHELMALLTPIAKAFVTEAGLEAANHGVQIYGGHGFIREWGMEQNVRDARISTLYEGTTGIQALDLLGRKVLMSQGKALRNFTKIVHKFCEANADNADLQEFVEPLAGCNREWGELTQAIGLQAMQNPEYAGGASVDYLMYSGYVTLAYLWALMASKAQEQLAAGAGDEAFYNAKIKTARFYFKRILPRTAGHKGAIEGGVDSMMDLDAEHFAF
ncbi:Acyl-CoA dehydrogenase [Alloalcanivorax dieselolei B5]|uniref:3-methylmercaptopropionyl-CoA dehydrogenase n=1 Tax=Alcanivorax dieselolei (strain DSM 16502 / CGMCC 1.3690 / MCCC 1A00001 / B-5) TaxID=930169 RepID=K0CC30_ALCDB|nr:acyl-CoA dehydrogenase C-terminal domain-containing protein [Alloalcanivorax dieselolei]AFT69207.1 Acyl-CoA dehydrogenase [Alloalcanivorax dieselolei B5]GGJ83367.1 acyl-CoA dehydrogenase [Alloalcanivorax dieselolei]